MKCPFCYKQDLRTLETRECSDNSTRRRKECMVCNKRFTTYEHIEIEPLVVIKRDTKRQPYDIEKVRSGIRKACEKRDISEEQVKAIADEVDAKIHSLKGSEIKSTRIGMYILNRLKKLDKVVYMRFASVYRGFENIEHFENEINRLQK